VSDASGESKKPRSPGPLESVNLPDAPVEIDGQGKSYRGVGDAFVRQALALLFFLLFAATVVLSFFHLSTADWDQTKEWLQVTLPAETALLGSATGFYFGTRHKD
jgi:hypothetical protein